MAIPKNPTALTVPFDRSLLGQLREATVAAETGLYRIEELEATLKSADSFVEGWKAEAEQLRAENKRLREELIVARDAIASQDSDAFGVVPETHDCPAYAIRDELIHNINKALEPTND